MGESTPLSLHRRLENKVSQTSFKAMRARCDNHEMEVVGKKLRDMMPWIAERKMVDKSKN